MHKPQTYYYCCCMQPSFLTSDWHFQSVSWCYGQCYIVGSLLCFGVGIVRCPFNLLYYIILVIIPIYNTKKLPIFLTTQSHSRSITTFHSFLIFQ